MNDPDAGSDASGATSVHRLLRSDDSLGRVEGDEGPAFLGPPWESAHNEAQTHEGRGLPRQIGKRNVSTRCSPLAIRVSAVSADPLREVAAVRGDRGARRVDEGLPVRPLLLEGLPVARPDLQLQDDAPRGHPGRNGVAGPGVLQADVEQELTLRALGLKVTARALFSW